jgi:hypothetical protein
MWPTAFLNLPPAIKPMKIVNQKKEMSVGGGRGHPPPSHKE